VHDRHQSVQEFWDELADAALPPTKPLQALPVEDGPVRRPSSDLSFDPEEFTQAVPPQARFETPRTEEKVSVLDSTPRPRIVVPFNKVGPGAPPAKRQERVLETNRAATPMTESARGAQNLSDTDTANRSRRFLVALLLILAFSGMLLATHKYVTSHWNTGGWMPELTETFVVGREGVTTTDVNLRPDASTANSPIGIAEIGSKVKVLNANSNWYEVQVLEHGRAKTDPYSSDRGWINKKFVKFD
jgi:hypothetical protein